MTVEVSLSIYIYMMRFVRFSSGFIVMMFFLCTLMVVGIKGSMWGSLTGLENDSAGAAKKFDVCPGHVGLALLGYDSKPFFRVVVPQGTSLPARNSITLTTSTDDQSFIDVSLYFGKNQNPHLNTKMDTCRIKIPSRKKGEVRVRIDIAVSKTGAIQLLSDQESSCLDTHDLEDLIQKNLLNEKERLESDNYTQELENELEIRAEQLRRLRDVFRAERSKMDDAIKKTAESEEQIALAVEKLRVQVNLVKVTQNALRETREELEETSAALSAAKTLDGETREKYENQIEAVRLELSETRTRCEEHTKELLERIERCTEEENEEEGRRKKESMNQEALEQLQEMRDMMRAERINMNDAIKKSAESEEQIALAVEKLKVESFARVSCEKQKEKCEGRFLELEENCAASMVECESRFSQLERKCTETSVDCEKALVDLKRICSTSNEKCEKSLDEEKLKCKELLDGDKLKCEKSITQKLQAMSDEEKLKCEKSITQKLQEMSDEEKLKCEKSITQLQDTQTKILKNCSAEKLKCEDTLTRLMEATSLKKTNNDEDNEMEARAALLRNMRDVFREERIKMDNAVRRSVLTEEQISLAAEKLQVQTKIVRDMQESLRRAREEVMKTQEDTLVVDCESEIARIRMDLEKSYAQDVSQFRDALKEAETRASILLERVSTCEKEKEDFEKDLSECETTLKVLHENFKLCKDGTSSCSNALKDSKRKNLELERKNLELESNHHELKSEFESTKDVLNNELMSTRIDLREKTSELDVTRRRLHVLSEKKDCHEITATSDDNDSLVFLTTMALILVGTVLAILAAARAHMASKRIEQIERSQNFSSSSIQMEEKIKQIKAKFQKERDRFKEMLETERRKVHHG